MESRKMVLMNLFARAAGDPDIETDLWTQWGKVLGVGHIERVTLKHIHYRK